MLDATSKVSAKQLTRKELDLRSHLVRLVSRYGFLHGTVNVRERACGKSNCKCTRGEKHSSLYVVMREGGELRQQFIPKSRESEVYQWIERYQEIQKLIDEISNYYWDKIQKREE